MPLLAAPVAPLGGDVLLVFLLQVGILLGLAVLLGRLAARAGMPAVVGELAVGLVLGPSLLPHVAPGLSDWLLPQRPEQAHLLDGLGQVGVLMLVGVTGMHLDLELVRRRAGAALGISLGGLVPPFALGIGLGLVLPGLFLSPSADRLVFALFMGVAMCVSAIPVIAKTLMDLNLLHRNIGQLILTAGMVDDAFGWLMLAVVSAMAGGGGLGGDTLTAAVALVGIVVAAALVGRPVVRAAFRLGAGRTALTPRPGTVPGTAPGDGPDGGTAAGAPAAVAAVLILLGAAGTHALHLEAVFGAFVMGILVGNASGVDPARLAPLRTVTLSVLAPVFFATAGLRMDLTELARPQVALGGAAVLAIAVAGKFAGVYAGARLSRMTSWEGLALGAGLNARGVIEVVVAMVGLRLGVLTTAAYTVIVLVAIVTSVMAPPILRYAMARVEHTADEHLRRQRQDGLVSGETARSPG
ncbi:cation:proton antiporter [Actinomadura rubrisoli]|uniref:Cation:proton antiporter n=1 Tax=Actinomadura rubrisoli TaxID=2530368 RepID=A0A4V2YY49_9ACTN|nr:cation:proton antiporter [Actinomadura rubrisoli]TDD91857.1 cation:proton antiporter [Actinomadura rubrisoli]